MTCTSRPTSLLSVLKPAPGEQAAPYATRRAENAMEKRGKSGGKAGYRGKHKNEKTHLFSLD